MTEEYPNLLAAGTPKTSERVALFDLDSSLADFEAEMRKRLEPLMSPNDLEILDREEYRYPNKPPPWLKARKDMIKRMPGFWRSLPPIPFGLELFDHMHLILGYTCMVLTKGPSSNSRAWTEKVEWCDQHVPEAQITITEDKGLVYGKLLYDDYPPYIKRWLEWRPRGRVLMLDAAHNQDFEHPNVLRCYRQPLETQLDRIHEFIGEVQPK